ncbi:MAG: PAS domain-containing protein [Candidatus Methylomirabilales bacterium]
MVALPRLSLTRWLSLLVLAAVLPLLFFGALTLAWLTASYRTTADAGQADTTRALALAIDAEIRAWKAALLALAETNELRAGRLQDFYVEASQVARRYGGWIGLADRTGRQVLNTARGYGEPLPATAIPGTVAAVFRKGSPAVSDVWQGRMAPLHLITVAVPVLRDGEVRYALHLSIQPDILARLLGSQHFAPTWDAAITDSQHRIVARLPHRADRVGQPIVPRLQAAFASRQPGFVEGDITESGTVRLAFDHLNEAPWVVSVGVPLAELRAAWRTPLLGFLLVGTLLGLLAVGLAAVFGRHIARPIHALARDSALMLRGGPIARGASSRIEEVHRLQEALGAGAEQAQAYYREQERSARAEEAAKAAVASARARQESQERIEHQLAEIAAIYDSAPVGLCVLDPQLRYVRVNAAFAEMLGLRPADLIGRSVREVSPGLAGQAEALLQRVVETGKAVRDVEVVGMTPGAQRTWIEHRLPLKDAAGRVIAVNIVADEVTERRRAEEDLRRALRDNQILLREVHHRTKNNLQMLADLLYLKAESTQSAEGKRILEDSYLRIFAFARLHEQLYLSMHSGHVHLCDYVRGVVKEFQGLHPELRMSLELPRDPIDLDLDRTIHAGLIVNELLLNAAKHAFPAGGGGEVSIGLEAIGDRIRLRVRDSGRGLPSGMALEDCTSLGLRLVRSLAQRLGAELVAGNCQGALFTITFPLQADPPREPAGN